MSGQGEIFRQHLPEELRGSYEAGSELDANLTRWLARGRGAWPTIQVPAEELLAYVAQRVGPNHTLEQAQAEGLYLACACSLGDEEAAALFRASYQPVMDAVFRRLGMTRHGDEISQRVLGAVLVEAKDGKIGIAGYAGRGSLANWVRVVTVREAYRVGQQERRVADKEKGGSDERIMDRAVSDTANPELLHLKRDYRVKFKASFQSAFDRLEHRERNILRYQYLDGLNLDQIATIYAVGRATVARWRAQARARLLSETRKIMRDDHHVPMDEFDGAVRMIESAMDVSLSRLLGAVARDDS